MKSFVATICLMDKLDGELRQRAARYKNATSGEILTKNELRQVSRMLEPEVATMVFYQSLLESKFDRDFINLVNNLKLNSIDREFNRKTEVAIVPSTFVASGLRWGFDAEIIQQSARDLGFRTELLDTRIGNTLNQNAAIIGEYLRTCTAESIVLVSRNRGSAEVRLLLQERDSGSDEFKKLKAWVSVTGVVQGSLFLNKLIASEADSILSKLYFKLLKFMSLNSGELQSTLEQGASAYPLWDKDLKLPEATTLVQLLGLARPRHISGLRAKLCRRLQREVGPNDGFVFVEESCLEQGLRYPLWGLHSSSSYSAYKSVFERILIAIMQSQKFLKEERE